MSTYTDPWNKDKDLLMGGGGQYGDMNTANDEQKAYVKSISDYSAGWDKVDKQSDAMEAYVMLFVMMANQGMDELTDKTATDAGSLSVQGDLTKLGNDMETLSTQDADKSLGYVDIFASHGDDMIGNGTTDNGILGNADIQRIVGSDPTGQLASQYQIIRAQIYVSGSSSKYNGDPSSTDCYFDQDADVDPDKAGPTDKMNSFGQLHTALGLRGDPYSSNESEKGLTNAFNENTSTTQGTNAASQEIVSNDQNNSKGVQSFIVAGLHSITDVESAAIKKSASSG